LEEADCGSAYMQKKKKGEEFLFTLFHSTVDLFFAALFGSGLLASFSSGGLRGFLRLGFGFLCHIRPPMRERQIEMTQAEFACNGGFRQ
jgi:hypothetical protein